VLVAGIAAFKTLAVAVHNPSASLIQQWIEHDTFVWLITEEILAEYKAVLGRLGVRRPVIGSVINLLREEAETVEVKRSHRLSPDPGDDPFCNCADQGHADFIVTLNPKDFPQGRLTAKVIGPGVPIPTTAAQRSRSG
jgi:predicted nucleic acid-binding protein